MNSSANVKDKGQSPSLSKYSPKKHKAKFSVKGDSCHKQDQLKITDHLPVVKKRKLDRFNGLSDDEVILKTLPDRIVPDLDILIIGINPGLYAAYLGHHYAGPGNHFWKCLYLSGLVPEPMNCYDDVKVQELGIGFTNICARTTKGSEELKRLEVEEGCKILLEKLKQSRPKIAVFNGKGIYCVFSGNKKIVFGKQPVPIAGTNAIAYVMPSSSARCAQLPRAIDKVPFFESLRKLRDHVIGRIPYIDELEVTFPTLQLRIIKRDPSSTHKSATRSRKSISRLSTEGGCCSEPSPVGLRETRGGMTKVEDSFGSRLFDGNVSLGNGHNQTLFQQTDQSEMKPVVNGDHASSKLCQPLEVSNYNSFSSQYPFLMSPYFSSSPTPQSSYLASDLFGLDPSLSLLDNAANAFYTDAQMLNLGLVGAPLVTRPNLMSLSTDDVKVKREPIDLD